MLRKAWQQEQWIRPIVRRDMRCRRRDEVDTAGCRWSWRRPRSQKGGHKALDDAGAMGTDISGQLAVPCRVDAEKDYSKAASANFNSIRDRRAALGATA